jgi:1,4-dihydroxy-2-naphthoate octaprenyltransferase
VPYALVVTTVLIGKHVDKYEQDGSRGIRTLPVILGREFSLRLNQLLMIAFYRSSPLLVLRGTLGLGVLLVALRDPALCSTVLRAYNEPKPAGPPPGYRLWPLWYVSLAFYHNRLAAASSCSA